MRKPNSIALAAIISCVGASAQGEYVNFEVPVVHGLEIVTASTTFTPSASRDYLAVCNTDNDTIEFYDILTNAFAAEVSVGLRPVSVHFDAASSRVYTANYLGDSVSIIELSLDGSTLNATLVRTEEVCDAPTDLYIDTQSSAIVVISSTESTSFSLNPQTLASHATLPDNALLGPPSPGGSQGSVMKEPRRIIRTPNHIHVISLRGDNFTNPSDTHPAPSATDAGHSYDMASFDVTNGVIAILQGKLGSANFDIAESSNGDVFVTALVARNEIKGSMALSGQVTPPAPQTPVTTGFAESHLFRLTSGFTGATTPEDRDLNLDSGGSLVGISERVSTPTSIALFESPIGDLERVFVTSFGTDRIVALDANPVTPISAWTSTAFDVPAPAGGNGYLIAAPRSLAIRPGDSLLPARLYSLNRGDNSISVFDPAAATPVELARVSLQQDPNPNIVRTGRRFLYDAKLSGNHTVSCASCHIDGRTDGMSWYLDEPSPGTGASVPIPPSLLEALNLPINFPDDKGAMVTQTFQGLLNHPMLDPEDEAYVTNAPYHWRGDRARFEDFDTAFVSLLGAAKAPSQAEMSQFRAMINTIMYPPNPEQLGTRLYSGSIGDFDIDAPRNGSGAARGMKLFNITPLTIACDERTCVDCHALPEGSNNRITEDLFAGAPINQPLETAQMRGLQAREGKMIIGGTTYRASTAGLSHSGGLALNIEEFANVFSLDLSTDDVANITAFMREFDSGIAPSVGDVGTINALNAHSGIFQASFLSYEAQANMANVGIALLYRYQGNSFGLYYDTLVQRYRVINSQGESNDTFSSSDLLDFARNSFDRDDIIVVQITPVGAERRYAAVPATAPPPNPRPASTATPSNISLQPFEPPTQWRGVEKMSVGAQDPSSPFKSLRALALLRESLFGVADSGYTHHRHEAPRRPRVTGDNIDHGAVLLLGVPAIGVISPPPYGTMPGSDDVTIIELPLFATTETIGGQTVWESTVELEPVITLALQNGGFAAPDVMGVIDGTVTSTSNALDPVTWNNMLVQVRNPNTNVSPAIYQPIQVTN